MQKFVNQVWSDPRIPGTRGQAPTVRTADRSATVKPRAAEYRHQANSITLFTPYIADDQDAKGTLLHELAHALVTPEIRHTEAFRWVLAFLEHLWGDSVHDRYAQEICSGWKAGQQQWLACPLSTRKK